MDPSIYDENDNNLKLCFNAEMDLRDVKANAQKLKDSKLLQQAHAALTDIWEKARSGPIESNIEWDDCRRSVNHSINLIGTLAKQLDTGKFDFQELKTQDNRLQLLVALKTLEIAQLKLEAYDRDQYYHLDQERLDQLKGMLKAALCLLKTTYNLLKA